MEDKLQSVQTFGRKKNAVAVAYAKRGKGVLRLNGTPLELITTEMLRYKAFEPIMILGRDKYANLDIRVRVKGGGHVSQIYAIRQALAKAIVAFYQKWVDRMQELLMTSTELYVDEQSKLEVKQQLLQYDRTLLVSDPRRCEPKKFGGRGARSRFQKSYR